MRDRSEERRLMVQRQVEARGIHDPAVVTAMCEVPRELFLPEAMDEFAYEDTPLVIEEGQTISQPFIVALMAAALRLTPSDRVLEIGTGSGYAAAVLGRIAREVHSVERIGSLAESARERLDRLGYGNVLVHHANGTLGWQDAAPYDAIVVTAGGPEVPAPLLRQLALGARLVIPIGETPRLQRLVRVIRHGENEFSREELGQVQFVPLIGEGGWSEESVPALTLSPGRARTAGGLPQLIREQVEPIPDIESVDLGGLLERIGSARVVLLGEATHGSSEFYRMRARITRELIVHQGFTMVAAEADWPDAAHFDRYARRLPVPPSARAAFTRFPTWMWRNAEVEEFVQWLRWHNDTIPDPERRVAFHGLDLYSMFSSIDAVLTYLSEIDPAAADLARRRYGCLTPWERDPARYGEAALSGRYRACEPQVVAMLRDLLERRVEYSRRDGERFIDAAQNARLIANAERYYRVMYLGSVESWNLRDRHMFDTLQMLLNSRGPESRAVVWAHNSHVGDAAATEMSARGEFNIGHLSREAFGSAARIVGFGTDRGTVAAATNWDAPMEIKAIRPALAGSYERLFAESGIAAGLLHLREPRAPAVREELLAPRLERAIGVIYRPESELASHYFQATLPRQFDEYVWFAETRAVQPVPVLFTPASSPAA